MVVTTAQQVTAAIPAGAKVGTCGFRLKAVGDMHQGHVDLVKALKKEADFVVANLWQDEGFYETLMNIPSRSINDPYKPDVAYCADFVEKAGANVVWTPPEDFYKELLDGYDPVDLMVWAQTICLRNKYTFFGDGQRLNNLYYYMISNRITKEKNVYLKQVRAESIKDGITVLYRKHFDETVNGIKSVIIPPTLTSDGLPMAASLKYKDKDHIGKLSHLPKIFKKLDLTKTGAAIKDDVVSAIGGLQKAGSDMVIQGAYVYENAAVGDGRSLIEVSVSSQYNSTYTYSVYVDHEKGTIL